MSRRLFAAVAALLAVAPGAFAQAPTPAPAPAPPPAPDGFEPAEALLARMPQELLGAPGLRTPNSPMIIFMGRDMLRDPTFGILAVRGGERSSVETLREGSRGAFHETGIRRVLREGSFTTPAFPGANTFFGEYLTNLGLKQRWTMETGSEVLIVTTTIMRMADRDRAQAEIATRIFGGAVVTAAPGDR